MSQITVTVPTELSNLGVMVQSIVSDLNAGKSAMTVIGGVLPILFAEGAKWEDIKAELKDPQVYVLLGVVLGGIAAKLLADKAAATAALPQVAAPAEQA